MISKEEVKKIANLARIDLTASETERFQKELSSILDYIEKLKEVDVSKIEPTSHAVLAENVTRQDEATERSKEESEKFLALAPQTKESYFKVKSIF